MLTKGQRREGRTVADCELLINVMQVDLDGTVGNIQLASDLLVRQSFGYQAHDLAFALGQQRQYIFGAGLAFLNSRRVDACERQ